MIIAAHGPVPDEDNTRWLDDMRVLAEQMDVATSFASIKYLTVRDDAPKPVRDAASAELRQMVEDQTRQGRRVLIVPLLLSWRHREGHPAAARRARRHGATRAHA